LRFTILAVPGVEWLDRIAVRPDPSPSQFHPFVSQRLVPFEAKRRQGDLALLKERIEAGKVTPVIDRT